MADNLIVLKSKAFALRIIKLYQHLQDRGERNWLDLLLASKILPDSESSRSLLSDNTELIRLLVSSTKRLKGAQDD